MTTPRLYWKTMIYACDKCGHEVLFYLEDGCEGPPGGGTENYRLPRTHPVKAGQIVPWPKTPSGRHIVPVPLVAAGCVKCQGPKPWDFTLGVLQHVRWNEDVIFPVAILLPAGAACFQYPASPFPKKRQPDAPWPCGIPYLPPTEVKV